MREKEQETIKMKKVTDFLNSLDLRTHTKKGEKICCKKHPIIKMKSNRFLNSLDLHTHTKRDNERKTSFLSEA